MESRASLTETRKDEVDFLLPGGTGDGDQRMWLIPAAAPAPALSGPRRRRWERYGEKGLPELRRCDNIVQGESMATGRIPGICQQHDGTWLSAVPARSPEKRASEISIVYTA